MLFLFFLVSFVFSFFFLKKKKRGLLEWSVQPLMTVLTDSDFGDRRRRTWKSPQAVKPLTDGYACFVHGNRSNTYRGAFSRQTQPGAHENRLLLFYIIIGGRNITNVRSKRTFPFEHTSGTRLSLLKTPHAAPPLPNPGQRAEKSVSNCCFWRL